MNYLFPIKTGDSRGSFKVRYTDLEEKEKRSRCCKGDSSSPAVEYERKPRLAECRR